MSTSSTSNFLSLLCSQRTLGAWGQFKPSTVTVSVCPSWYSFGQQNSFRCMLLIYFTFFRVPTATSTALLKTWLQTLLWVSEALGQPVPRSLCPETSRPRGQTGQRSRQTAWQPCLWFGCQLKKSRGSPFWHRTAPELRASPHSFSSPHSAWQILSTNHLFLTDSFKHSHQSTPPAPSPTLRSDSHSSSRHRWIILPSAPPLCLVSQLEFRVSNL